MLEVKWGVPEDPLWWRHQHKDLLNLAEESRSRTRQSKNAKYLNPKISTEQLPLLTQPGSEI